jgi:tetratricopeptide (TPR) repeat protein
MIDEAIEIAQDGLRVHPHFLAGKVALARAYFDRGRYNEVIDLLDAASRESPDNLAAQKLLGESFLLTGRVAEALASYKTYLYFVPLDTEVAKLVKELEQKAYEQGILVLQLDTEQKTSEQKNRPPLERAAGPRLVYNSLAHSQQQSDSSSDLAEFAEAGARAALSGDPGLRRQEWIEKVEKLQKMLQSVERYRGAHLAGE